MGNLQGFRIPVNSIKFSFCYKPSDSRYNNRLVAGDTGHLLKMDENNKHMGIVLKTPEEIEAMRVAGHLAGEVLRLSLIHI